MRRTRFLRRVFAIGCVAVVATPAVSAAAPASSPYTYIHHPVSTSVQAAQAAFDRGLTLVFAYESEEAERAFRQAARLDPTLAMAWWGIALSVGPNINIEPEPKSTLVAADSIARATLLAGQRATPGEREYIDALNTRYSSSPNPDFDQLAMAYHDAMRRVVAAHPDDADASALYAEAIMDLHAWRLWDADGRPGPETLELVSVLEKGMILHPDHLGLTHYYIHAVEASNDPGRALGAAKRLGALPMEPAAAHLVHMPGHIYLRVGDWAAAIEANQHSIHHALDYRLSSNPKQVRACGHCVDFLTYAYMMNGSEMLARSSAREFQEMSQDPSNALAVLTRFHQWDDLLTFPEPAPDLKTADDRNVHAVLGLWHYGRGLAFVATGRLQNAESELNAVVAEAALAPPSPVFGDAPDVAHTLDKIGQAGDADSLKIAAAILRARIAAARSQWSQATDFMREAVRIEDATAYGEPPTWAYPIRESLGALLLKQNLAAEAEAVFREGLRRSPRDPRLLLGLSKALSVEGRNADAAAAEKEFRAIWQGATLDAALL